jgi:hypothetical protein
MSATCAAANQSHHGNDQAVRPPEPFVNLLNLLMIFRQRLNRVKSGIALCGRPCTHVGPGVRPLHCGV